MTMVKRETPLRIPEVCSRKPSNYIFSINLTINRRREDRFL
jgi:hypothetical protein